MPRECFFLETTVAEYTCRLSQGPNMWPFADKRVYLTTDPACSTIIKSSEADRGTYKKEKEEKKRNIEWRAARPGKWGGSNAARPPAAEGSCLRL